MNTVTYAHRVSEVARKVPRPRPPRTRRGRSILAFVLVLVLAGGAGGWYWYNTTHVPDDAAFKVDGRVVTTNELSHEMGTLRALYGVQQPKDKNQMDKFRRDAAKSYAVALTLDHAAEQHHITIADKTARDVLDRYISEQLGEGFQAHQQFVQALGNSGTNEPAVLKEIKRQLGVGRLFDQVTGNIKISDAELRHEFPKRQQSLGTPEKRHIQNIVVQKPDDAQHIADQLRNGAHFATLASQASLDGSTRDNAGDLGTVDRGQMEDAYAQAAFTAPPGSIYGPVQTTHGWNVGKVDNIIAGVPAQFDQVKDKLRQQMEFERAMNRWRSWLHDEITHADVRYADDYRPAHPDAPPESGPVHPASSAPNTRHNP